jgi:hypothetical protein
MPRGSVSAADADFASAIVAIGFGHDEVVEAFDAPMLGTLVTTTVNAVDTVHGVPIPVEGLQVGDTLIGCVRIRVDDATGHYSSIVLDDVLFDVSITDEEEVTFEGEDFGPFDSLLIFYVDESTELA